MDSTGSSAALGGASLSRLTLVFAPSRASGGKRLDINAWGTCQEMSGEQGMLTYKNGMFSNIEGFTTWTSGTEGPTGATYQGDDEIDE